MRRVFPLILILLALPALAAAKPKSCIDWPRQMASLELDELPAGRVVIVNAFQNATKQGADDWLVLGLRDYLTDLLRAGKELRVLSGITAVHRGESTPPAYTIGGLFQHVNEAMRVFIQLSDGSGKLLKQFEAKFAYPENKDFFRVLAETATGILNAMEAKVDGAKLRAVRDATASTRAYENYAKGRQALEHYDVKQGETARLFFEQTKRADYRSPLGYMGLVDLYTFLGFVRKQQRESYGGLYQKAQAELIAMAKEAKPAPWFFFPKKAKVKKKPKAPSVEIQNPFLLSNVSFVAGLHASGQNNWKAAAAAFEEAVRIVPIDAITWYHLARMRMNAGGAGAAQEAYRKALAIDPCLEGMPLAAPSAAPAAKPTAPATGTAPAPSGETKTLTPEQQRGMIVVPKEEPSPSAQPKRWE